MAASEHMGRRREAVVAPQQPRAMVAAARKVDLSDKAAIKRETRTQDWHPRAWRAAQIGEIKYSIGYFANLLAKLRIFAAVQIGDEHDATYVPLTALLDARATPAEADEAMTKIVAHLTALDFDWELASTAVNEMRRFRSVYGGQSELLRRMAGNIEIAGECWVVGMEVDTGDGEMVETWEVLSNRQVRAKPDDSQGRLWWFRDRNDRDGTPIESGTAWKVWLPDLEYHMEPDSLLRGILDEAETLVILTGQMKAEARSAHTAGLLLLPNELSSGTPDPTAGEGGREGSEDPFLDDLEEAVLDAVLDPDSAATVFPPVIRGPGDVLDKVKHISLTRDSDEFLDKRIENRVVRCARGLNMPVEVVLGHQATTYANADQVDEDTYTKHVDPRAVLIVQALTFGFLHPQLRSAGFDREQFAGPVSVVVWYDPSALVRKADPEEAADSLYEKFAISGKALRQVKGFSEDDAPLPEELLMRLLLTNRGQMDVAITEALIKALLPEVNVEVERPEPPAIGPAPADDEPDDEDEAVAAAARFAEDVDALGLAVATQLREWIPEPIALPAAPDLSEVESEPEVSATMLTAAAGVPLGRVLLEIDRELRAALWAAAEAATVSAIERAGIRARNTNRETKAIAAGLDVPTRDLARALRPALIAAGATAEALIPDDAFDHMESQFKTWVSEAGEHALNYVEEATSGLTVAEREAYKYRHLADRDEAWAWMKGALLTNARGNAMGVGEDFEDALWAVDQALGESSGTLVPPGLVRTALARAGGNRLETDGNNVFVVAGGKPPAGVATGPTTIEAAHAQGARMESYRWDYGQAPRAHPFAPHKALHGRMFTDFNDDALLKFPGQTWPPFSHYFPGDHYGCICDAEPILATARQILTSQGVSRRQQDNRLLGKKERKGKVEAVEAEPEEPKSPLGLLPANASTPDNAWVQQAIGKSRTSKRTDMRARGYSTAFDGPDIEGFDLHQRGIKLSGKAQKVTEADYTEIKFKLTDQAADRLRKQALTADSGWKSGAPGLPREDAGHVNLSARGWSHTQDANNNRRHLTTVDPDTGRKVIVEWHDIRPTADAPYAIRNQVRVYVEGGEVDDALLQRVMRNTGMTEHSRYPTGEEVTRYAEAKLIDTFSKSHSSKLTGSARTAELERIAKAHGVTPADLKLVHAPNRHVALELSDDATAKLLKATKTDFFTHSLSSHDTETLVAMMKSNQGGMSATLKRWSEGVGGSGMSSTTDMRTGGADYVFTRPQTAPRGFNPDRMKDGTVYIAPERVKQLDWFAYGSDTYGTTNPHSGRGDYTGNDNIAGLMGRAGSQETMFRHGVAWQDVIGIGVDPYQREGLLARLKAEGIDVVPGTSTPVEDFFVSAAPY